MTKRGKISGLRICNLCKNSNIKHIVTVSKYKVYQCEQCKVAKIHPFPSAQVLKTYYTNFDYKTGFVTEKLIREEAKKMLRMLGKNKGELIDIGCGAGFYLNEAQRIGWNVTGVEMSTLLARYARSKFRLHVINQEFTKAKIAQKFDAIILSQVIEHLTDPVPTLIKIRKLLKDDGIVYIATPNIQSWLFYIQREDFPYMIPPEHVCFYSPQSLKILFNRCGFKINLLRTYGYQQDLAGIIKRLAKGESKQVASKLNEQYREYPQDPIRLFKYIAFDKLFCAILHPLLNVGNLGSMIQVIAQKD